MPKAQSVFSSMYGWRPPEPLQSKPSIKKQLSDVGGVSLTGRFKLKQIRDGDVVALRHVKNVITDVGKAAVAGLMIQTGSTNAFDYIALGTGTATATSTQTALATELSTGGGERALATLSRVTTSVTNDTAQLLHTFTFTNTYAITEAGVFDSSSSGTMLSRQKFTAVNVVASDTLEVTWQIDVA